MDFQIPEDLGQFSITGLNDLRKQAETEFNALVASVSRETLTVEDMDDLEALQAFVRVTVPGEIKQRRELGDRFSALQAQPEEPEGDEGDGTAEEPVPVAAVVAATSNAGAATTHIDVKLSDIVERAPEPQLPAKDSRPVYSTLVAAAGVPNYEAGQRLDTMLDVAKAFEARTFAHGSMKSGKGGDHHVYPVAQLIRDYPAEFSVEGDQTDYAKLLTVADEKRLPGGSLLRAVEARQKELSLISPERDSLVAAQGWCAPSETDYSICLQITTDGLYDAPEVQARRGGIRHNTGIEFDSIFGGGSCSSPTGFFDLTEAQVAAGTTKTCLEIPCPDFVDTRLGVTGLCLTGNILAIRGYPEFTATFTRGALAAHAHQVNREQIADVVSGSTAVTLSGAPWATDLSVVSQVMSAVEMAIVDIKYRLRLQQSATLEVVMPFWILAQMRADWIRRNAVGGWSDAVMVADSAITEGFSRRGARVQYVYDWQDAFATCAASGSPGSDTPLGALPTSLQFLVYPAGTWVRAVSDVITLNSVYDSTKLATNQVTHLFTETGWAMVRMCPLSRVYTVTICPSGSTGLQRVVSC